jgi:hypothetical protein
MGGADQGERRGGGVIVGEVARPYPQAMHKSRLIGAQEKDFHSRHSACGLIVGA